MNAKRQAFLNTENCAAAIFFFAALLMPLFLSGYKVSAFSNFYISAILALSVSLVWGYTGIFSFGSAAFYGVSAYAYAVLSKASGNPALTPFCFAAAVLISTLFAALIGYFMFYGGINDVFVGLITLCVSLVLETFMDQTAGGQWQILGISLGGYNGINKVPAIHFGPFSLQGVPFYFLTLLILFALYLFLRSLRTRKTGYTLIAVRENRLRSQLFGYNVPFIQTAVFAASGGIAAAAGALYTAWGGYITPSAMGLTPATIPVVVVAAGGRKNITGAMLFAVLYAWFSQKLSASGSRYALIILGLVLIAAILFVPNGFLASIFDWVDKKVLPKQTAPEVR